MLLCDRSSADVIYESPPFAPLSPFQSANLYLSLTHLLRLGVSIQLSLIRISHAAAQPLFDLAKRRAWTNGIGAENAANSVRRKKQYFAWYIEVLIL